jgi:hypothetical protein
VDASPDAVALAVSDPITSFLAWEDITLDILRTIWDRNIVYWSKSFNYISLSDWFSQVERQDSETMSQLYGTFYDMDTDTETIQTVEQAFVRIQADRWMREQQYYIIGAEHVKEGMEFPK